MSLISFTRGQTGVVLRVKILNSSVSTGAGLAGLTFESAGLVVSTIADNEATATAYTVAAGKVETVATLGTYAAPTATKCRFKEVDATNHPGLYEIHLANARYAVAGAKSLLVSISGATNAAQCEAMIPLTDAGITRWYVETTGSDSNGGHSRADAFLTPEHAIQTAASAGDTIILGVGEFVLGAQIAPKVGQSILGAGPGSTIITANAPGGAFVLVNKPGVTIKRLSQTNADWLGMGLQTVGSSECLFEDCWFSGDYDGARCDDLDRSTFRRCKLTSKFDAAACMGKDLLFEDCTLITTGEGGTDDIPACAYHTVHTTPFTDTTTHVTLRRCTMRLDRVTAENFRAVCIQGNAFARINVIDCNIRAEADATNTGDIYSVAARNSCRINVSGGSIETINAGSGAEKDFIQENSATISVDRSTVIYNSTKTTGTITTPIPTVIAAAVWDALRASHVIVGSFGASNQTSSTTDVSVSFASGVSGYCTRSDISDIFGTNNVTTWADLDSDADADNIAAHIARAIVWATTEINDRLRGGPYEIPLSASATIVDLCATLAGLWLYRSRGTDDETEVDKYRWHWERCEKTLSEIRGGKRRLDATSSTDTPGGQAPFVVG